MTIGNKRNKCLRAIDKIKIDRRTDQPSRLCIQARATVKASRENVLLDQTN
jgi:hypothetical protein